MQVAHRGHATRRTLIYVQLEISLSLRAVWRGRISSVALPGEVTRWLQRQEKYGGVAANLQGQGGSSRRPESYGLSGKRKQASTTYVWNTGDDVREGGVDAGE